MLTTPNLKLPLLAAGQAQKHVTLNEALVQLDRVTHLSVLARNVTAVPASPATGARYLIATVGATGLFSSHPGEIASWDGFDWHYTHAAEGWLLWAEQEAALFVLHSNQWIPVNSMTPATLGINAMASSTNRLALSSPASLFNHEGQGHQLKINKAASTDIATLLFQTGFSGRAEMGCAGGDDWSIKVSADGANWLTALGIDQTTGVVTMPFTVSAPLNLIINGDFTLNQRNFTGGSLSVGAFGFDRWKAGTTGAILSKSTDRVTLASGSIEQHVEPQAFGLSSFAGQTITFSLDGFGSGTINATIAGQNIALLAGNNRRRFATNVPAGHTGPLIVAINANTGSIQFARVMLQLGNTDGKSIMRSHCDELSLAQRYYCRLGAADITATTAGSPAAVLRIVFPQRMRIQPVLSILGTTANFVIPAYSGAFTATPVLTAPYYQDSLGALFYSATGFAGPSAQLAAFLSQTTPLLEASAEF